MAVANFIIRVFKSWGARDPERRWVNSYEIVTVGIGSVELVSSAVSQIVIAEQQIHSQEVQFLSATVSTWAADSHPYDPDAFLTLELATNGARGNSDVGGADKWLDSNVCYLMKRQCTTGRSGKLFYRGCLSEGDVQMGGDGRFTLTPGGPLTQGGDKYNAYRTAMLTLLAAAEEDFALSLISAVPGGAHTRPVADLRVGGVTINRRNHRYFDRAPS